MALLVTSFHMSSYSQARGKDPELTPEQATEQGVDMAKEAIKIFQKVQSFPNTLKEESFAMLKLWDFKIVDHLCGINLCDFSTSNH